MQAFSSLLIFASFRICKGQYFFCTPLANDTWAAFVQAIDDSYRLAVICPFRISGSGCPSIEEYPEGLVVGRGANGIEIIECEADLSEPYSKDIANTQCVIDCPGRHFTVGPSSTGLILTNMVLSGATNSSIRVEANGRLEVVNGIFERNKAGTSNAGVIETQTGSLVSVQFSTFRNNQGLLGGAIHAPGSSLQVKKSSFISNRASEFGGAISIGDGTTCDIEDSSFSWNEASNGGALSVSELGALEISRAAFNNNAAIGLGGAIHLGGLASIAESTFQDNIGVDGGGAINSDVSSELTLFKNTFVNNLSTGYGPAVYDGYNRGVVRGSNTACGNNVVTNGSLLLNENLQCNGVYTMAGQLRLCQTFQTSCVEPTNSPSVAPILLSSFQPSGVPTMESTMSTDPSKQPSLQPSSETSNEPTKSNEASTIPSIEPSSVPSMATTSNDSSGVPSFQTSGKPSMDAATKTSPPEVPSFQDSGAPSIYTTTPSDWCESPSCQPSSAPSIERTTSNSPSSALKPAPGLKLSSSPSNRPNGTPASSSAEKESIAPSFKPSNLPSFLRSDSPSLVPSNLLSMSPTII